MPDLFSNRVDVHDVFVKHAFSSIHYVAKRADNKVIRGVLDRHGRTAQLYGPKDSAVEILSGPSLGEWDMLVDDNEQVGGDRS
jgi:hypothetical protein